MSSEILALVALAIPLFAATNVDNLILLTGFFADRRLRVAEVLAAQFASMALLILASLLVAGGVLALTDGHVGLLGLLPIGIGVYKLCQRRLDVPDASGGIARPRAAVLSNIGAVSLVMLANGGDNISAYAPVFALKSGAATGIIILSFLLMTALWSALAFWLVRHPAIGRPIRRYGELLLPYVLILIGLCVLWDGVSAGYPRQGERGVF
ncbi:cadmium resistance transporter [Rhodobacter sp. 24-YEA-8]|uniref:cadmium resistance transporter n=1 Tax=Rhodobacter sp. 24-YEA-8 TaxID=1884310 RepID=UPI00089AF804|nr:cadmium resistance transporter [Rhodobacter sp. 24-YEA-8]SED60319.1 Cadmium resistance protein CadD, predicted permease [Rhodobacter sp. 24-YEA-8]